MTSGERAARSRAKKKAAARKSSDTSGVELKPTVFVPGPLTQQIKSSDSFTRRFIDAHFPELKTISRECCRALRARGLTRQANMHEHSAVSMLVGTAIDYRVKAYFDRNVHLLSPVERGLHVLRTLIETEVHTQLPHGRVRIESIKNPWHRERQRDLAHHFIESFTKFIMRIRPERRRLNQETEDRLCRYCVVLAYLDWIGRGGPGRFSALDRMMRIGTKPITRMLSYVDKTVVSDVANLSALFREQHAQLLRNFRKATIGGTLSGSEDVGGADFDLLVDGCLIDIKTTLTPQIKTEHLRQLVGYWLLDYDDSLRIRWAAICLLRHGHTQHFDIRRDLAPTSLPIEEIREAFREGLRGTRNEDVDGRDTPGHDDC